MNFVHQIHKPSLLLEVGALRTHFSPPKVKEKKTTKKGKLKIKGKIGSFLWNWRPPPP